MQKFAVVVMGVCTVLACSKRDGKSRPLDAPAVDSAAIVDALSQVDASDLDAVSYLDAAHGDAASSLDAAHGDAAHGDAAHADAATQSDAAHADAATHPDAAHADAATSLDATAPDAATTTPGTVTCYTEGNPGQTCTLPVHCCWSNYTSAHDGFCTTATCIYGTITCDGPEDCGSGQHCCSHALFASDGSVDGYAEQCQATACGAAPANYELCHIGGAACSNGGTCVTAYLNDNDLPRTLDICQ